MTQDEIKALIEDLRLNHEYCPKEVILKAADELERMQQGIETLEVDQATMELAESVGLIGPTSRTHNLHQAIQRFHDLICVNATVKAAQMAAGVIRESTSPQRTWVGLTDREMMDAIYIDDTPMEMGRTVEAALKKKNT